MRQGKHSINHSFTSTSVRSPPLKGECSFKRKIQFLLFESSFCELLHARATDIILGASNTTTLEALPLQHTSQPESICSVATHAMCRTFVYTYVQMCETWWEKSGFSLSVQCGPAHQHYLLGKVNEYIQRLRTVKSGGSGTTYIASLPNALYLYPRNSSPHEVSVPRP